MITRFAVLPDERRLLLGIDKANLFEAGMVYEAFEILGEIVIKKKGPFALALTGDCVSVNSDVNHQVMYGYHLLTQEEFNKILENELQNREG